MIEQVSHQRHGFSMVVCMVPVLAQHPVYFGQVSTGALPETSSYSLVFIEKHE